MKKTLALMLALLFVFTAFALTACNGSNDDGDKESTTESTGNTENATETVKLGFGVAVTANATDADAEADKPNGKGTATVTVAAVTLDKDGKILSCEIDCADASVAYTPAGEAIANDGFKTKYELGYDYNMITFAGSEKEWFEQVDTFEALVVGKTATEVKALVLEDGFGADSVVSAGCTIAVADFVKAVVKATENTIDTEATTADTLKLGAYTEQTTRDANEDANGYQKLETTFVAATVNAEGKITAATFDCVQVQFDFDASGASAFDASKEISSKRELGFDYNMVNYQVSEKEWFEQADVFASLCIGKTATEIVAMMAEDNYGTADVKGAGCTILVNGFAKAAAKLG